MSVIIQGITYKSDEFKKVRIGWSTYSTTGSNASITPFSLSTTVMLEVRDWVIISASTIPTTTGASPTSAYDITITDDNSIDVMGGALLNRKATGNEMVQPLVGSLAFNPPVLSGLTFNLTGNSATGASGVCELLVGRPTQRIV